MIEPAAVQVHGLGAGYPPPLEEVSRVKKLVGSLPVLAARGTDAGTARSFLQVCDPTIVGSSLKYDGPIRNPIDPGRAKDYMKSVLAAR
jgi:predicted TIM-barrel enzyme